MTNERTSPRTKEASHARARAGATGVRAQLATYQASLPPAQRRLAAYLLEHLATVSDFGITELAEDASVSPGTISLLCRRLGLRGYQDLRLSLAREAVVLSSTDASYGQEGAQSGELGSVDRAIQLVFGNNVESLSTSARNLDRDAASAAVDQIGAARRVEFVGVGTAGLVAAEGALKLRKLGIDAIAHADNHQQKMSVAQLSPEDVVVAISHSGRTIDVLRTIETARAVGAAVVAITGAGRSPLSDLADIVLPTVSYDTAFQTEPMASTVAELSIVQLLFLVLLERGGDVAQERLMRTQAALESAHVAGRYR